MTPEEAFKKLVDSIDVYDESFNLTKEEMMNLGMRAWDVDPSTGRELWLFPFSYYDHIPAGFPIVDLDFEKHVFQPHTSPKDRRFGLLSFGMLGNTKA